MIEYFEFQDAEYYALVTVSTLNGNTSKKAIELYHEVVSDEEDVTPTKIRKEMALLKYAKSRLNDKESPKLDQILQDFEKRIDDLLLIDGSLI